MFICGSGSFSHEDKDDRDQLPISPCSTPKRTRRCNSFGSNKNPYADRGLDKFHALLADHDDKKQRILKQSGSEEISLVRFVYPNESDQAKPIVVKAKEKKGTNLIDGRRQQKEEVLIQSVSSEKEQGKRLDKCFSLGVEVMKEPCCYLPVTGVLILVLLVIFGRSLAVLCLSIGWYLVPSLTESASLTPPERKQKRKKVSERPCSPTSVLNGPHQQQNQQRGHKHKRSW